MRWFRKSRGEVARARERASVQARNQPRDTRTGRFVARPKRAPQASVSTCALCGGRLVSHILRAKDGTVIDRHVCRDCGAVGAFATLPLFGGNPNLMDLLPPADDMAGWDKIVKDGLPDLSPDAQNHSGWSREKHAAEIKAANEAAGFPWAVPE